MNDLIWPVRTRVMFHLRSLTQSRFGHLICSVTQLGRVTASLSRSDEVDGVVGSVFFCFPPGGTTVVFCWVDFNWLFHRSSSIVCLGWLFYFRLEWLFGFRLEWLFCFPSLWSVPLLTVFLFLSSMFRYGMYGLRAVPSRFGTLTFLRYSWHTEAFTIIFVVCVAGELCWWVHIDDATCRGS